MYKCTRLLQDMVKLCNRTAPVYLLRVTDSTSWVIEGGKLQLVSRACRESK